LLFGLLLASKIILPPLLKPTPSPQPWMPGGPQQSRVFDRKGEHMASGPAGVVVKVSARRKLRIDCAGLPASIDGNLDRVVLTNCPRVSVNGSHNGVTVSFAGSGGLDLHGDANHVRWSAPTGSEVAVSDIGRRNEVKAAESVAMAAPIATPAPVTKKRRRFLVF
jgi:hypothetical protein